MLHTGKKTVYKAFGLLIASEILMPELPEAWTGLPFSDVEILLGDVSEEWRELKDDLNEFSFSKDRVLFEVADAAIFSIEKGNRIIVTPLKNYDEDIVRLYILGTCMGAILLQKKILPLHGSAIAIDGKAYGIIGNSGAGKSTLASALLSLGHDFLSDDIIAISLSENDGHPEVIPAYPQQKLWSESLENFGKEAGSYRSIYGRETKYNVPVENRFHSEPLPLAGVFELIAEDNQDNTIITIRHLKRFFTFYYHTFRNFLIPSLNLMEWHFHMCSKLISSIPIYQVRRASNGFTALQLAELILEKVEEN
ncbi:aldolase [Peribacillus sp. SCS-37]|uniref:aldolase n=1 Tax=Paraperibacillus esterisolvens TaxID=3115296 RepID=UPI0039060894